MTAVVIMAMLIGGAVFQAVFPPTLFFGQTTFPILPSLVFYYASTRSLAVALAVALTAGLLQDALGLIPLGYSALCFCTVAWVINSYHSEVFVKDWVAHALLGGLLNLVVTLGLYFLLTQKDLLIMATSGLLYKLLGALISGALVVPFVFKFVGAIESRLGVAMNLKST